MDDLDLFGRDSIPTCKRTSRIPGRQPRLGIWPEVACVRWTKVIVDGDSKGDSFLVALSRDDGHTLWRVDRTRRGISYSAPMIGEMAGRMQLIQCGDRCVASFDPDTGKPIWTVDGPSEEFVATPVYSEKAGLVFVSSSWPQRHLLAIKPDGRDDVQTDSQSANLGCNEAAFRL